MSNETQEAEDAAAAALVDVTIELIDSFNPVVDSIDGHIYQQLGEINETVDFDKVFVQQAFYGAMRHKKVIEIFLSALYHLNGTSLQRSEHTRLKVFSYLILFRLDELGMKQLIGMLNSQDLLTMHILMNFAFDEDKINTWVKSQWCKHLDRAFVEDNIMARLRRHKALADKWLKAKQFAAYGSSYGSAAVTKSASSSQGENHRVDTSSSKLRKQTTKPIPFNLTKPRPRLLPEPKAIRQTIKANPVPDSIHKRSLTQIEEERQRLKEENARQTAAKYANAAAPEFQPLRRNTEQIRAEIEAERDRELQFDKPKYNPVPIYPEEQADVKLTYASILREEALFRKRQEKEAQILQEYEAGLHDTKEFDAWQAKKKLYDEQLRMALVEARRAEMAAATENAAKAVQTQQEDNRKVAAAMRGERDLIEEYRQAERLYEQEVNQQMAQQLREHREQAPKQAKTTVLEANIKKGKDLREQVKKEEAAIKKQREEEQKEREELIRQIRALERVPKKKYKEFDPTTCSNLGLLEEMSIVEMRERLSLLKARAMEIEEARRLEIRREKREKEEEIRQKLEMIKQMRHAAAKSNIDRRNLRTQEKEIAQQKEIERHDQAAMTLAEKLAAKRQARELERLEEAERTERIQKKNTLMGAARQQLEERHFDEFIRAQERATQTKQLAAKKAQAAQEAIEKRTLETRRKYEQSIRRAKAKQRKQQAQAVDEAYALSQKARKEDYEKRKEMFLNQVVGEESQRARRDIAAPYTATVRTIRQDAARERRGGPNRAEEHTDTLTRRLARMNPAQAEKSGMSKTLKTVARANSSTLRRLNAMTDKDVTGVLEQNQTSIRSLRESNATVTLHKTRGSLATAANETRKLSKPHSSRYNN